MPRNAFVFPYGITLREGGSIEAFPAAEVAFRNQDGEWLSLIFVIDSGATISALPKSDAAVFGINPEDGAPLAITGVAGETIRAWRHELSVRLGNIALRLPLTFLDTTAAPRVLGREGVFDRFSVVFEEERRRSGFLEKATPHARRIRKILDQLSR